jgi:hypothetical protein
MLLKFCWPFNKHFVCTYIHTYIHFVDLKFSQSDSRLWNKSYFEIYRRSSLREINYFLLLYRAFLITFKFLSPTNALYQNIKCYSLHLKYLFVGSYMFRSVRTITCRSLQRDILSVSCSILYFNKECIFWRKKFEGDQLVCSIIWIQLKWYD